MPVSATSAIQSFVHGLYLGPARAAGEPTIDVRLGHVRRSLELSCAPAIICAALESPLFARRYGVKLLKRHGPRDGEHTLLTFRVMPAADVLSPLRPAPTRPAPRKR